MTVTRRDVLAGSLALAGAAAHAQAPRPNIVFILADDMGYADLSCYDRPGLRTPNIDRIGQDGARLLQGYANSAVCTASRTAIITGRYQYRLAVGLEEPLAASSKPTVGLPAEHPTLPSLLRALGYETSLIGKWHLGQLPAFGPLQSGYDHFYGYRSGAIDYFSHVGSSGTDDLWDGDVQVRQAGYMTELLADRAIATIGSATRPFFISLHFNAPHWPWEGPDDQAESARVGRDNLRDWDGGTQRTYEAMIETMDQHVGRVLAALEAKGAARDTIVVFTSDNGGERFADTWPFTGRKTELLEGGLRVPALIRWPARIPAGQVNRQVAIGMDWLPTLLAAAGGAPDPAYPTDGIDLLPALTGAAPAPRTLYWRYKANWQRAVRDGDMKYLKIIDNTFLFDVAADPMERANLKARQPETYARLAAQWLDWNAQMRPETGDSFTEDMDGAHMADRIGLKPVGRAPDPELVPK